jgi:hypothetical protein
MSRRAGASNQIRGVLPCLSDEWLRLHRTTSEHRVATRSTVGLVTARPRHRTGLRECAGVVRERLASPLSRASVPFDGVAFPRRCSCCSRASGGCWSKGRRSSPDLRLSRCRELRGELHIAPLVTSWSSAPFASMPTPSRCAVLHLQPVLDQDRDGALAIGMGAFAASHAGDGDWCSALSADDWPLLACRTERSDRHFPASHAPPPAPPRRRQLAYRHSPGNALICASVLSLIVAPAGACADERPNSSAQ